MRVTLNGIRIEYEVAGSKTGIPVVFVHGFPFGQEMWKPQVEALKRNYYVITYDVRGHGKSDAGDGQYSVEYFVDDLIAVLDHLHVSKVVAVGLSMGGYILLRAIERQPDRFRALVLCDTRSEADGNFGKIMRATQAKAVKVDGTRKFVETFLQGVFHEKTFQTNQDAIALVRDAIKASPIAVAGTLLALAARTDTTPSLYNIKVPTLILVGQHDTVTPPSASHAMKEKIPNAELHVIARAAHMSNLENTEEFNSYLMKFLGNIK